MKTIKIHGIALDFPEDHWFLQMRRQLPGYCENIGRLAAAAETKYPGRGFVDMGSDIGEIAAIVRAYSRLPILCVEESGYRELLEGNVRRLPPDVELAGGNGDGSFAALDVILTRHPSFRASKLLKIQGQGMFGRIGESAFDWIAAARPILYWRHSLGPDASVHADLPATFERLLAAGYRTAVIFDNQGEFMQTISLSCGRQLAEICNYFPGGVQCHDHGDICSFHDEDLDLCERFRQGESENRRLHGRIALAMQVDEVQDSGFAGIRAHTELERHRLHRQIADLETHISLKDAEINRLHAVLRDLLRSEDLKSQVAALRQEMDTSLALRMARSLHWFLGPIRRRIGPRSGGGRP